MAISIKQIIVFNFIIIYIVRSQIFWVVKAKSIKKINNKGCENINIFKQILYFHRLYYICNITYSLMSIVYKI